MPSQACVPQRKPLGGRPKGDIENRVRRIGPTDLRLQIKSGGPKGVRRGKDLWMSPSIQ